MTTASKVKTRHERTSGSRGIRRRGDRAKRVESLFGPADRVAGRSESAAPATERERRLEEVMLTTWAALVAGHPIECPVCGGPLTAARGCTGCGSKLS